MKILEQYLKAVGIQLPWKKRKDITDELRSLMLDQIEEAYGSEATEEQVKEFLADYGSPDDTASAYKQERPVIAPGLADLFRLIILIMAGAMMVAFTVVGIIEILEGSLQGGPLAQRILKVPLQAFQAWLAGVGMVTIIFMGMSRLMRRPEIDMNEDWKVEDLKDVKISDTQESRLESYITIGFLSLFIVLMNVYPGVITLAENMFSKTGLGPHHLLVIERFRFYVIILSAFWVIGIVLRILILRSGEKGRSVQMTELGLSVAEIVLNVVMLTDTALFISVGSGGWIGFKVIIVVALVANAGELFGGGFRMIRSRIAGE